MAIELRPFQRRFLARALASKVDTAALSLPRGEGKSALAAHVLTRCLTPSDGLFQAGAEYLLLAASLEQARNVYRPIRADLEPTGEYSFIDSVMRLGITHKPTKTRLRVMSSNAHSAFGIVGTPLLVADEPGAWAVNEGQLMNDAIQTAQGKLDSPLKVIYIGTLAPAQSGWWHELVESGTHGSTYVQSIVGKPDKWDTWREIKRCNPLKASDPGARRKLLEERDAARADPRLKARFLSYRLNKPTADETQMLLSPDDLQLAIDRPLGLHAGRPIVAVDLGGGRSWSAAVAVWQSGRCEALAVAPGIPDLSAQERRDRVPAGLYRDLFNKGVLGIADGLRVQPPAALWDRIVKAWGVPVRVLCDRFRLAELEDAIRGACLVEPRVTRWSEAAADIRALRKISRDGPLSIPAESQLLIAASLSAAIVKNDEQGNTRLIKRGKDNVARDDVAAALTLAAGAFERAGGASRTAEPLHYAVVG